MSKPTIIAQISDLHIKAPGELAYGKVDTARALERCVAELNALDPRPDLVVISGDLVDTPTPGEYEYLWRLLAPLKIPFIGVPGNHDARDMMRAAFPDWAYAKSSGPLDQVRTRHHPPWASRDVQFRGENRCRRHPRSITQRP